jgi:hypothetical protein
MTLHQDDTAFPGNQEHVLPSWHGVNVRREPHSPVCLHALSPKLLRNLDEIGY